jgi:hypothetical protein
MTVNRNEWAAVIVHQEAFRHDADAIENFSTKTGLAEYFLVNRTTYNDERKP